MRQKYSTAGKKKKHDSNKYPETVKVKEFLASVIALNTFVDLLKGFFINGQWISLKASDKVEISPFMSSNKKLSKGQIK